MIWFQLGLFVVAAVAAIALGRKMRRRRDWRDLVIEKGPQEGGVRTNQKPDTDTPRPAANPVRVK
jgi:membrane protein implicated in regulation of membrane protease activity